MINLANQIGLFNGLIEQDKVFHNASKCNTWNDIYVSHSVEGKNIVLVFDHVLGMVIFLSIGLGAALFIFILENITNWIHYTKVI